MAAVVAVAYASLAWSSVAAMAQGVSPSVTYDKSMAPLTGRTHPIVRVGAAEAQAAYEYLEKNLTGKNGWVYYSDFFNTEDSICKPAVIVQGLGDRYYILNIDMSAVELESIAAKNAEPYTALRGYVLTFSAALGKTFYMRTFDPKTVNKVGFGNNFKPAKSDFIYINSGDAALVVRAFTRLAQECGAKPVGF